MHRIHINTGGDVDPVTGTPLLEHYDYTVSEDFAKPRYQRGTAVPAAQFYMGGLVNLGLTGVTLAEAKECEPNMAKAAKDLGLKITRSKVKKVE